MESPNFDHWETLAAFHGTGSDRYYDVDALVAGHDSFTDLEENARQVHDQQRRPHPALIRQALPPLHHARHGRLVDQATAAKTIAETKSAPSSIVTFGSNCKAATMC